MPEAALRGSGKLGPPLVVDTHIHAAPSELIREMELKAFPDVAVSRSADGTRFQFPGMRLSPPAPARLSDFDALSQRGQDRQIDVQVVGPWTDLLGYTLPRPTAFAWSVAYNETLVDECQRRDGLMPMCTVPLQFPDVAADVLQRAHALGCRGVMIGSDIPGLPLDARPLDQFWEATAALSMPVLLHPNFLSIPERVQRRGLKNAVARIGEITLALTELIYSGALLRYPTLTVIGALGGGALVPGAHRILRNQSLGWSDSDVDIEASLHRLMFDSIVLDQAFLRYLVAEIGADHIVMGSDHPFPWEPDPVRFLSEARLPHGEFTAILGQNASRLFGLDDEGAMDPTAADTRG